LVVAFVRRTGSTIVTTAERSRAVQLLAILAVSITVTSIIADRVDNVTPSPAASSPTRPAESLPVQSLE
jgi:hypothetical protein